MGIGNVNLASTPCCGLINRSYECYPDKGSQTGWTHNPGGAYVPDVSSFKKELEDLDGGICPDCGNSFREWLVSFGFLSGSGDFSLAQNFWEASAAQKIKMLEHLPLGEINKILAELHIDFKIAVKT